MYVGDGVRQLRRAFRVGTRVNTVFGPGTMTKASVTKVRRNQGPVCVRKGFAVLVVMLDKPRPCSWFFGGHVSLDPHTHTCSYCDDPTETLEPNQVWLV